MKNLLKLSIMLAALLVFTGTNTVIAQEAVVSSNIEAGVSSNISASALPGNINFDPPSLFAQTLPLQTYMNNNTNAVFVGGNGAVLSENSNFGVTGHSSPNFLAYNPSTQNSDGSIPALPAIIYFPNPVNNVSMLAGAGSTTGTVILAALDASFTVVAVDVKAITPAMQLLSVAWNPGIQAVVVVGNFTSANKWMVLDNLRFQ
ncbi:MAG: hypothetical protein K8F52_12680 [Candidatus Scalindua rubra]|uniref:Uncharacterized protein n=1 Tax=Candidatus Scalindua brodae TaxID=237368 RepID=A0A0B0EJN8_9BACT|nr:MAG: hypothetical protein SCABRO_03008 [Candidatus Scalindua brodae]MBZ0109514.1 hypothetical protein [Candidatus Scalindua rubra]TWU36925.1 hypothetical protein S225a_04220 [Candidatus Brocadiaceae bacterium S225]